VNKAEQICSLLAFANPHLSTELELQEIKKMPQEWKQVLLQCVSNYPTITKPPNSNVAQHESFIVLISTKLLPQNY
jgi:hypothetical protein